MKVLVTRTSNFRSQYNDEDVIEVNTLEDLLKLDEDNDGLIVWSKKKANYWYPYLDFDFAVEIYDDYRE